jgi:hypothetical protein
MPSSVRCQLELEGGTCVGSACVGRSYPGQVDGSVAPVSAGWTDASPVLPPASAWEAGRQLAGRPGECAGASRARGMSFLAPRPPSRAIAVAVRSRR